MDKEKSTGRTRVETTLLYKKGVETGITIQVWSRAELKAQAYALLLPGRPGR